MRSSPMMPTPGSGNDPGQPIVQALLLAGLTLVLGGVSGWGLRAERGPTIVMVPGSTIVRTVEIPVPGPPVLIPGPLRRDTVVKYLSRQVVREVLVDRPPDTVRFYVDRWRPAEIIFDSTLVYTPRGFWDTESFRPRSGTLVYGAVGLIAGALLNEALSTVNVETTCRVR